MTRFDKFVQRGTAMAMSDAPDADWAVFWDDFYETFGRYSRPLGIWVNTPESDETANRLMDVITNTVDP